MKKYMILLLISFTTICASFAQNLQPMNIRFLPQDYYVGDRVEMTFNLRTNAVLTDVALSEFPEQNWVEFSSFNISETSDGYSVRLQFVPYSAGTRTLPPLPFGEYSIEGLKFYTSSVLSTGDRELTGIQAPLLIPGTKLVGTLLIFLCFTLPVLLILLIRFIHGRAGSLIKSYRINLPYRQFLRLVKKIRSNLEESSEKEFFKTFSKGFKTYLSSRFHLDFSTLTTQEMEDTLMASPVQETLSLSLMSIFHRMDLVKFAGSELSVDERDHLLGEVEQVSAELEDWRKKHADL